MGEMTHTKQSFDLVCNIMVESLHASEILNLAEKDEFYIYPNCGTY